MNFPSSREAQPLQGRTGTDLFQESTMKSRSALALISFGFGLDKIISAIRDAGGEGGSGNHCLGLEGSEVLGSAGVRATAAG